MGPKGSHKDRGRKWPVESKVVVVKEEKVPIRLAMKVINGLMRREPSREMFRAKASVY